MWSPGSMLNPMRGRTLWCQGHEVGTAVHFEADRKPKARSRLGTTINFKGMPQW